jgi:hypothetical protein
MRGMGHRRGRPAEEADPCGRSSPGTVFRSRGWLTSLDFDLKSKRRLGPCSPGTNWAVRPCGGCRRQDQAAARKGCSRTARCGAPPGLLIHQFDAHRSCEGAKRVSLACSLPAATNCPERLTAYRKPSGGTGQCRGARAAGMQRRLRESARSSCG